MLARSLSISKCLGDDSVVVVVVVVVVVEI
jgi:hypothetical protein